MRLIFNSTKRTSTIILNMWLDFGRIGETPWRDNFNGEYPKVGMRFTAKCNDITKRHLIRKKGYMYRQQNGQNFNGGVHKNR